MEEKALRVPRTLREPHTWIAERDGLASRAQIRAGAGEYASAIPASIANLPLSIPTDLAADVDEASIALSGFDEFVARRLDGKFEAAPMLAILLRSEASTSSQIENLTAGARQLALAEIDLATSENAQAVVGNVRAMESAISLAGELGEAAVLRMHSDLLATTLGEQAGRYRGELVWIGKSQRSPVGAVRSPTGRATG